MASAAPAQWQPTAVARAALAAADPAADGGVGNQTLTQVPLNQRLPRIRRRKPSTPPTRQPAAAAANMVSEPAQPPCPVAAPPESTAAASTELAACLPHPSPVMQHRQPQPQQPQPQPQQAGISRPSGSASTQGTSAQLPLVPLHQQQQQQQQTAMGPPEQASSAFAVIGPHSAAGASAAGFQAMSLHQHWQQQQMQLRASDTEDTLSLTERIKQRRQALAAVAPAVAAVPPGLCAAAAVHSPEPAQQVLPQLPAPEAHGGHANGVWHQEDASGFSPISPPAAPAPPPAAGPGEADGSPHGDIPLSQVQSMLCCVPLLHPLVPGVQPHGVPWSDVLSDVAHLNSWPPAAVWPSQACNAVWHHDAGDTEGPPKSAQAPVHHATHPADRRREPGRAARQRLGAFPARHVNCRRRLFCSSAAWCSPCGIGADGAAQCTAPAACCRATWRQLPGSRR